jgi:hypothetical protein
MADTGFAVGENGNSDVYCDFVYVVLGTIDFRQGVTPAPSELGTVLANMVR